jgi:hypothetical protein
MLAFVQEPFKTEESGFTFSLPKTEVDWLREQNDLQQPLKFVIQYIKIEEEFSFPILYNHEVDTSLQEKELAARQAEEAERVELVRVARLAGRAEELRLKAIRVEAKQVLELRLAFLEAERVEAERVARLAREAEELRLEANRVEAKRLEAERVEAERLEAVEAERLQAERVIRLTREFEELRVDAKRVEANRLEAERVEAERLEAERVARLAREAEELRLKANRVEANRLEAERVEAERLEAVEAERVARLAREAEELRLEANRVEAKRLEAERVEAERLEAERLKADGLTQEAKELQLEANRVEAERLEAERVARLAREAEELRLEANRVEAKRVEELRVEAKRVEELRLEAERLERKSPEQELREKESLDSTEKEYLKRLEREQWPSLTSRVTFAERTARRAELESKLRTVQAEREAREARNIALEEIRRISQVRKADAEKRRVAEQDNLSTLRQELMQMFDNVSNEMGLQGTQLDSALPEASLVKADGEGTEAVVYVAQSLKAEVRHLDPIKQQEAGEAKEGLQGSTVELLSSDEENENYAFTEEDEQLYNTEQERQALVSLESEPTALQDNREFPIIAAKQVVLQSLIAEVNPLDATKQHQEGLQQDHRLKEKTPISKIKTRLQLLKNKMDKSNRDENHSVDLVDVESITGEEKTFIDDVSDDFTSEQQDFFSGDEEDDHEAFNTFDDKTLDLEPDNYDVVGNEVPNLSTYLQNGILNRFISSPPPPSPDNEIFHFK